MRPAHILSDDPFLDCDAVFGVKETLVAEFTRAEPGSCSVAYDFVLEPRAAD